MLGPSSNARDWWVGGESNTVPRRDLIYSQATAPACPYGPFPCWLRESDLNGRFVVMSHVRGLVTAPSSRVIGAGLKLRGGAHVHPVSRENWRRAEVLIPNGLRHPSRFERAPAARPVNSPQWRKAAVSIRSSNAARSLSKRCRTPFGRPSMLAEGGRSRRPCACAHHRLSRPRRSPDRFTLRMAFSGGLEPPTSGFGDRCSSN